MAFDWTSYLTLAKLLVKKDTDDASLRSAISRAYYAAFMYARKHWEGINGLIPLDTQWSCHAYISRQYLAGSSREERAIGNDLKMMAAHRVLADYDDEISGDLVKTALTVIAVSEKTINNIDVLKSKPTGTRR